MIARSFDGLPVSYSVSGDGPLALVFIHGGLADRNVWQHQTELSDAHRIVLLDLGGHGESGRERASWSLQALGEDVRAVVNAVRVSRAVFIGSSMGGPVALEAARLMPEEAVAVVGVDTLHDASQIPGGEAWREYVAGFRRDFHAAADGLVDKLFHANADPALVASLRRTMHTASPEVTASLLDGFTGYDLADALRSARVPVRCINGDLYPTDLEGNRRVWPDFDAIVMPGVGHYPMLERPDEFNRLLRGMALGLNRTPHA